MKKFDFNKIESEILKKLTVEEIDEFCTLTKKDYDDFRKHHIGQVLADCPYEQFCNILNKIGICNKCGNSKESCSCDYPKYGRDKTGYLILLT